MHVIEELYFEGALHYVMVKALCNGGTKAIVEGALIKRDPRTHKVNAILVGR